MSHKTSFLGTEPIFRLLLKMSIPATIGMLVNALYNIVDTIFVGRGVGKEGIAALTIIFPIQMIVSSFAQAMGFGAASVLSRRLGEKRYEDAADMIGTAYTFVFISTWLLVGLLFAFLEPILRFFGTDDVIMPYTKDYLMIVGFGFIFFSMSMTANSLVRAEGNPKASMNSMLIGAITNVILDPIFIFGLKWGIKGAATATVISQIMSCGYILSLYVFKRNHITVHRTNFKIRFDLLGESALLGIPSFVQQAGMCILAIVTNNTLLTYGGNMAITVFGMVHKFNMIIIMPIIGIAQGFQPIAGYNYGACDFGRVIKSVKTAIATAFIVACVGTAIAMIFPRQCMSIFITDSEVLNMSTYVVRMICSLITLASVQIVGATFFQAVGKPVQSLVMGLMRSFICLIPLLLILPRLFGLNGIWWSYPAADLLGTIITLAFLIPSLMHLRERMAAAIHNA
ncbi:MAG: MATE family efflux transporter [Spirochaetales bacterium]|nr:MATE family efflux transporter [Spirochaetales bacterium]